MLSRTGRTIWRVIIPKSLIVHIPEMKKTAWWHGPAGHFYNCLVDDPSETPEDKQMFEIAVHNVVPAATVKEKRFSWGIPATNERVESHFTGYDPRVREALSKVPEGLWKEFSAFTGPRLEKVTAWDKVRYSTQLQYFETRLTHSNQAHLDQEQLLLCKIVGFLLKPLLTPGHPVNPWPLHLQSLIRFDPPTTTGCLSTPFRS
jgi:salicylate hydroxylase